MKKLKMRFMAVGLIASVPLFLLYPRQFYGAIERLRLECQEWKSNDMTNSQLKFEVCDPLIIDYEQILSFGLVEGLASYVRVGNAATGEMLMERRVYAVSHLEGCPCLSSEWLIWGVGDDNGGALWPPSWWTRFTAKLP